MSSYFYGTPMSVFSSDKQEWTPIPDLQNLQTCMHCPYPDCVGDKCKLIAPAWRRSKSEASEAKNGL